MAYDVSSWFVDQLNSRSPSPVRTFTINGSDYSSRVMRWPKIKRTWNMVRPTNITVSLANDDQELNFFVNTPTSMRGTCEFRLGFTHPTSGDETILLYTGTSDKAQFNNGICTLRMSDKMKPFTDRAVGASNDPAVFSSSTMLASDIAWTLCTCYGGLSSVQSTSNEDIDWASFQAWAAVLSGDSMYVSANFEGVKVAECLKRLADMTDSAIYNEHGQIEFKQFSTIDSLGITLTDDEFVALNIDVDDSAIINKQHVFADYNVDSRAWALDISSVNSVSVNSFGIREDIIKDDSIWFVGSASAQNMAQRKVALLSTPVKQFTVQTPLMPAIHSLGETIRIVDEFTGIDSSFGWRMMETEMDSDNGLMRVKVDGSQIFQPFLLDNATLGLLDQTYNFLL